MAATSLLVGVADLWGQDGLILTVNSGTLKRLETALETAIPREAGIEDTFLNLSLAYLRFALAEKNLWAALFEHRMPEGVAVPDWHLAEHAFLIGLTAILFIVVAVLGILAQVRQNRNYALEQYDRWSGTY